MRRRVWMLAVVAVLSVPLAAQEVEKHVFVAVVDKDGTPIEGLTTEHFAIREGGRDRTVVRVEPLRTPMHVAVLVDTSAAGGRPDDAFQTAVSQFVERLASLHQVALYSFGDRAIPVVPFTQDGARLRSAVTTMFGGLHTRSALIDGIDAALRDMQRVEIARPVVVAITSESAEASGRSAGSVIKKLIAQSTAFHAVSLAAPGGTAVRAGRSSTDPSGNNVAAASQALSSMIAAGEGDRERNQVLDQGTAVTGGSRQRITSTMALSQALSRLSHELANSYRVTFARSGSDRIKDLQVGILVDGVILRATPAPFGTR